MDFDVPESAKKYVTYAEFHKDPIVNALGTASGKIEIFSKKIASYKYADCPPHPTWLEPIEWLGSPKAKQFPLHLVRVEKFHGRLPEVTAFITPPEIVQKQARAGTRDSRT